MGTVISLEIEEEYILRTMGNRGSKSISKN